MTNILLTGGTGLVGRHLVPHLRQRFNRITILTRRASGVRQGIRFVHWDILGKEVEEPVISNADVIIHLAGENIGSGRWNRKRKQAIHDSRIKPLEWLMNHYQKQKKTPKALVSASAIGYYGARTTDYVFSEADPPADDFLGTVCRLWEEVAYRFKQLGTRVVTLRTGVVLNKTGGALGKMVGPIKMGLGAPLGSGRQYLPWIHIDDLVAVYLKAISDESMCGAYNVAAPEQVTNAEFMALAAQIMNKPYFLPNIPEFILNLLLGEMAAMVTRGSRVSVKKLLDAGVKLRFPTLRSALEDLLME